MDRSFGQKERALPAFTDLGVAALLFIGFLTLKAWDVGAPAGVAEELRAQVAARNAALIVLGIFAIVTASRALAARRWFVWSGAAAGHAVLHGLMGLAYLWAGAIAAGAAALALLGGRLAGRTGGSER